MFPFLLGVHCKTQDVLWSTALYVNNSLRCVTPRLLVSEADVAQSVGARPSELEGRQFDPRHSIDVCFDFPLFRVAVALNTRKTEH